MLTDDDKLSFAAAIERYAQHLASHTSAIQGLSEASHELKRGAAEQNPVLMHLMETISRPGFRQEEPISRVEPAVPEPEKTAPVVEKPLPQAGKKQFPPGCARNRQPLHVKSWIS